MTRPVPKPQWPALLELLGLPMGECFNSYSFTTFHELDDKIYEVTREYGFDEPLDISVMD